MSFDALLTADFKTSPWAHQIREFEEGVEQAGRALLWQMRTGKSKMIVDTACHLYRADKIDAVLVFAPNGVHENWALREVPNHAWPSVPCRTRVWITDRVSLARKTMTAAARATATEWWAQVKEDMKHPDLMWLMVNNEAVTRADVRKLVATIRKKRRVLVVWDESSDYRTPGSKRTLMMRALAKAVPYRRILDGTASTNSPLHLFSQFELAEPGCLGFSRFSDFEAQYAEYEKRKTRGGKSFETLSHYKNLDDLKQRMAPYASVVLRSDCEDLPEIRYRIREVDATPEQNRAYEDAFNRALKELAGEKISIREQASKLQKLQQISSGFVIDEFKEVHPIPGGNPRLDAVSEEVRLAPGKVIVWCQYQREIDMVAERLKADGHKILEYHGRVSAADKAFARKVFQEDPSVKCIVGQPQAGGRGLDLSAADHVMFYSHGFDAIIREQAKERATKMAGANVDLVDIVVVPDHKFIVDHYVIDATDRKVNVADDVAGRGLQEVLMGLASRPDACQGTPDKHGAA